MHFIFIAYFLFQILATWVDDITIPAMYNWRMKKIFISLVACFLLGLPTFANHLHLEKEYQACWCNANNGVMEYKLPDYTRVDCLTDTHAIEFDFAPKVYESIGQALYYSLMTNKKAGIVLILENPDTECKYVKRLEKVAKFYHIDYWFITPKDIEEN